MDYLSYFIDEDGNFICPECQHKEKVMIFGIPTADGEENVLICTSCRKHFTDNDLKKISVKNKIDVLLYEYDKLFPNGIIEKIAFLYDEDKKFEGPRR